MRPQTSVRATSHTREDGPGLRVRGALGGTRTPNLLIRSQMLYPLSYERRCGGQSTTRGANSVPSRFERGYGSRQTVLSGRTPLPPATGLSATSGPPRQDQGTSLRDGDRVLGVGRAGAVGRPDRPPVRVEDDPVRRPRQPRLE